MRILLISLSYLCIMACNKVKKNKETPISDLIPPVSDSTRHETFSYKEGDTTYIMQKYFVALLKKGPNRTQPENEYHKIQTAHQAWLEKLHLAGKISLAGPLADDSGEIVGITVFNTPTLEEAQTLMQNDPAVKAGRLTIEILPWWAAKGSSLK